MGLTIVVQDEHGRAISSAVEDVRNLLSRLLPTEDDESFRLLRYIDRYGDTVFNQQQLNDLLAEWVRLKERARTKDERELLAAAESLIRQGQNDVHQYIKFIGD